MNNNITQLTVKQLLSKDRYRIPIYQRNYDWEKKETLLLINDIADYAVDHRDKKYYIGSLIVFKHKKEGEEYYETVDGQQRLTTLTIMMHVLKKIEKEKMAWFEKPNMSYDYETGANVAINEPEKDISSEEAIVENISKVYKIIDGEINNRNTHDSSFLNEFVKYLLEKVVIFRIPLPDDTELNHYFEIMNSRGEQLEKHEIVKARLMGCLDKRNKSQMLFNEIWEACTDMNSYVQMNMRPILRGLVFSKKWDKLDYDSFDELRKDYYEECLYNNEDEDSSEESKIRKLSQLFDDADKNKKYYLPTRGNFTNDGNDRFGSVINFPNFLLQVLKVMLNEEKNLNNDNIKLSLDDKDLLEIFENLINKQYKKPKDRKDFVKRFIMTLLRMRFLFDKYVIKSDNYKERTKWSLKALCVSKKGKNANVYYVDPFSKEIFDEYDNKEDNISKQIIMLETMFHVSDATPTNKHWLNAILYYLYNEKNVKPKDMCDKLYKLACTYMLDRYLTDNQIDFEKIIYKNNFSPVSKVYNWSQIDCGCSVPNFVFNFYDYITWSKNKKKYRYFEFSNRTSVEHFYPQNPNKESDRLEYETLDRFGNLCLLTPSKNSHLGNKMPWEKCKIIEDDEKNETIGEDSKKLSLKLNEMMGITKEKKKWYKDEINEFDASAKKKLEKAFKEVFPDVKFKS